MPDATVPLGVIESPPTDALSGTKLHTAIGQVAGAAVATASGGMMGMTSAATKFANIGAVALIAAMFSAAFFWLRADAMTERADYRAQVLRAEQMSQDQRRDDAKNNEDRRKEDRGDRQRLEELFSRTLDTISRDSRDSSTQVRLAAEQMKAATEAMLRIEKLLSAKTQPPGGP
jgi:hypothetical protein